jgi:hypothetical protein
MKHKNYLKMVFVGFKTLNGEALVVILMETIAKYDPSSLHTFTG